MAQTLQKRLAGLVGVGSRSLRRSRRRALADDSVLGRGVQHVASDYELREEIGRGSFGTVFLAVEHKTGIRRACKTIRKRHLETRADEEDVRREVQIMHLVTGHENVVELFDVYESRSEVCLIMTLCNGDVFDTFCRGSHYTEQTAARTMHSMMSGVAHCHSLGVVHLDLKPENFLLAGSPGPGLPETVRLADFGLSSFIRPGQVLRDIVGSEFYIAPEVIAGAYGKPADVWSLGVILYILLCGKAPFPPACSESATFENIRYSNIDFESTPWPSLSKGAKECAQGLLERSVRYRWTLEGAMTQPWIARDGAAPPTALDDVVLRRLLKLAGGSKLRRLATRAIATQMAEFNSLEVEGLRQLFQQFDADGDGTITHSELVSALEARGHSSNKYVKELMGKLDIDGDGKLDYHEFLAGTLHHTKLRKEDNLMRAFHNFDTDGDGFISSQELAGILETSKWTSDSCKVQQIMEQVDRDHNGRIDFKEFELALQERSRDLAKWRRPRRRRYHFGGLERITIVIVVCFAAFTVVGALLLGSRRWDRP